MMETFIVLGLCFILYEALDFFQGCMHSAQPTTSDQIDAYRRQLDEQRQQQQQEQILANLTPLLGQHLTASLTASSPLLSPPAIISELRQQQLIQQQQELLKQAHHTRAVSTPALPALAASNQTNKTASTVQSDDQSAFCPAAYAASYTPAFLQLNATSSLPRDYYYLQQQQLKNKSSAKSLLSKFSSNSSDNRIFPSEATVGVLGGVPEAVITTQPTLSTSSFDCQPPLCAAEPLLLDLKRAILSSNPNISAESQQQLTASTISLHTNNNNEERCNSAASSNSSASSTPASSSSSASAGSASLASCSDNEDDDVATIAVVDRSLYPDVDQCVGVDGSVTNADYREIECERLRRKCVNVKRIYSISEKF